MKKKMGDINFYLRKKNENTGLSVIYLQWKYDGQHLNFFFGETIDPDNWNIKRQRAKSNKETTTDKKHSLNDLLIKLEEKALECYRQEKAKGIPPPSVIKEFLQNYLNSNLEKPKPADNTLFGLIDKFISGEIGETTEGTKKTYQTAKMHLSNFQKLKKYNLDFNSINLEFKFAYVKYLKEVAGLSPNSVYKEIKNVKTFMNMAVDLDYTDNLAYKKQKFRVKQVKTDAVYISHEELRRLFEFDFSGNKRLEPIRDFFVFNCYVGLRYGDAKNIKAENIIQRDGETYIKIITQKTGTPVIIPCHELVMDIFKKYESRPNRLPHVPSNQKFNDFIKEVFEIAGFKEKGRLSSDLKKPLFDCITSHTARRSFATNFYLDGFDMRMIMMVTGHESEKTFLDYIKVSREENAKRMGDKMKTLFAFPKLKAV